MKGFDALHAQHWLAEHWQHLIIPICVLAITLALGYAAKRLMVRLLRPWAKGTSSRAAQIVIDLGAVKQNAMSRKAGVTTVEIALANVEKAQLIPEI